MKPVSSAKTGFTTDGDGRLTLWIDHDIVRGVTPAMLHWWFEHIGETMEHGGKLYPRYMLWHPKDHILWELKRPAPNGGAGQGAYFRIVEAFGRKLDFYVDSTDYVEKLDDEGISLVGRAVGLEFFRLEHRFIRVSGGTQYRSRMSVGMQAGFPGRLFNIYVRPRVFSNAAAQAWLTHNVEEVGMFEHFLPELYHGRQMPDSANVPEPARVK